MRHCFLALLVTAGRYGIVIFFYHKTKLKDMAYDIYGQNLASGHCEVHPWVGESYPCSLCYAENASRNQKQYDYDTRAEAEYYAEMERAHYEELARKNNLLYRMLCYVALSVSKLNERVQKYKEKMFNKVIEKCH